MWVYDKVAIGMRIKTRREALHLTQEDVAERIEKALKTYQDIERGSTGMSIETAMDLCIVLEISPTYLFFSTAVEHFEDADGQYDRFSFLLYNCTREKRAIVQEFINVVERML